ncbi:hypothetical protein AOLI_G00289790 [Acnodon oligacanthus]
MRLFLSYKYAGDSGSEPSGAPGQLFSRFLTGSDSGLCISCSKGSAKSSDSRRLSIQRCIQSLLHACQCRNASCSLPSCQKMKRVVQHTKGCKRKTNGGCPVCRHLIALCCYHAKHCQENKCPVPFCLNIKHKFRLQQAQMMWQRLMVQQAIGSRCSSKPYRACGPH